METTSFKKGEDFEKFVEEQLFSKKDYVLVHRTNNYEQNKDRYAEDTLYPDFKFRCKKTLNEFYVEAKFRSNFDSKKQIDIMNVAQFDRFNAIEYKETNPIYLAIGLGGKATFPERISLIPLKKIKHPKLTENFVKDYYVSSNFIKTDELNLNEYFNLGNKIKIKETNRKKTFFKTRIVLAILVLAIIISGYTYSDNLKPFLYFKTNKKPQPILVKSKSINEYYDLFEYGTTVEGKVKNKGVDGYVIIKVELNQEGEKYNKSKKIYLEKNNIEGFRMKFYETQLLKKAPTVKIKVIGVEN